MSEVPLAQLPGDDSDAATQVHWITDGARYVIAAKQWRHGDQGGFTPHARFLINGPSNDRAEAEEEATELDSEQIAKRLATGELHYVGVTGQAPST